jgi:hypothetical protein
MLLKRTVDFDQAAGSKRGLSKLGRGRIPEIGGPHT